MNLEQIPRAWLAVGFVGQFFFSCRFVVQWIVSERRRASVIPPVFWWLSVLGAICLLAYAVYRKDPVFILGQSVGMLVYARNIVLLQRRRNPARRLEV